MSNQFQIVDAEAAEKQAARRGNRSTRWDEMYAALQSAGPGKALEIEVNGSHLGTLGHLVRTTAKVRGHAVSCSVSSDRKKLYVTLKK